MLPPKKVPEIPKTECNNNVTAYPKTTKGSRKLVKFTKYALFTEIVILLACGITLPTADVYSDIAMVYQLFTNPNEFQCYSDVIRHDSVQNGHKDCIDGSDEHDMPEKQWKIEDGFSSNSTGYVFECLDGQKINDLAWIKDGYFHCSDGSDENGEL